MSIESELDDQIAYYRAIADEYEDHAIDVPGKRELLDAFDAFQISGDVLELACGPGAWTEQLVARSSTVTAIDASPEMLRRATLRVGDAPVRFIGADLFSWRPDRRYDAVFFGFWLSHVPEERFDPFWSLVAECLEPNGLVFFVDDNYRTEAELIEGADSSVIERRLNDGTTFRAIKVPHRPDGLEQRLRSLGWDITVSPTSGPFYSGAGGRAAPTA